MQDVIVKASNGYHSHSSCDRGCTALDGRCEVHSVYCEGHTCTVPTELNLLRSLAIEIRLRALSDHLPFGILQLRKVRESIDTVAVRLVEIGKGNGGLFLEIERPAFRVPQVEVEGGPGTETSALVSLEE